MRGYLPEERKKFSLDIPVNVYRLLREEAIRNERSVGQQLRAILKERYKDLLEEI